MAPHAAVTHDRQEQAGPIPAARGPLGRGGELAGHVADVAEMDDFTTQHARGTGEAGRERNTVVHARDPSSGHVAHGHQVHPCAVDLEHGHRVGISAGVEGIEKVVSRLFDRVAAGKSRRQQVDRLQEQRDVGALHRGLRLVADLRDVPGETIASATHRGDVAGLTRVVVELAPQAVHEDAQRVLAVGRKPAPYSAHDRVHWQRLLGVGHEKREERVLGRREVQPSAVEVALLRQEVDPQPVGAR